MKKYLLSQNAKTTFFSQTFPQLITIINQHLMLWQLIIIVIPLNWIIGRHNYVWIIIISYWNNLEKYWLIKKYMTFIRLFIIILIYHIFNRKIRIKIIIILIGSFTFEDILLAIKRIRVIMMLWLRNKGVFRKIMGNKSIRSRKNLQERKSRSGRKKVRRKRNQDKRWWRKIDRPEVTHQTS